MKSFQAYFTAISFATITLVESVGLVVISKQEIPWMLLTVIILLNAFLNTAMAIFDKPQDALEFITAKIPLKAKISDTLLIFVCSPDDAEVAVGDLLENYDKIAARRSKTISNIWFFWELSLLFIAKARKRIVKATLGPFLDKFFKPNL